MSHNRPMNQRDEYTRELISAYLDGELSSDEQVRVEQLLVSSAAHRRTLEEIESLSSDMRALPRHRLDEAFSQRVVAAARQVNPEIDRCAAEPLLPRYAMSGWKRYRKVGLAIALAAATLLLVVFLWDGHRGTGQLARHDGSSMDQANLPSSSGQGVSTPSEPSQPVGAESQTRPVRSAKSPTRMELGSNVAQPALSSSTAAPSASFAKVARGTARPLPQNTDGSQSQSPSSSGSSLRRQSESAQEEAANGALASNAASTADKSGRASSRPRVKPGKPQPLSGNAALTGTQKMLFVIDVQLTSAGAEHGSFERALHAFGIAFDSNIDVKPQLEVALLKSRFFEPVEHAQDSPAKSPFTLVYVASQGKSIDELWRYLKQSDDQFARVTLDMAIKPGDMTVFKQLQQLAQFRETPSPGANADAAEPGQLPAVAHRLVFPPSCAAHLSRIGQPEMVWRGWLAILPGSGRGQRQSRREVSTRPHPSCLVAALMSKHCLWSTSRPTTNWTAPLRDAW